jgi:hypothetical protein
MISGFVTETKIKPKKRRELCFFFVSWENGAPGGASPTQLEPPWRANWNQPPPPPNERTTGLNVVQQITVQE